MYEQQTFEVILSRMLNNLPNDIDKREGSVAYDMLAPKAIELTMAYLELDNAINLGFADTTYGEFLDRKANESGVTRKPSVKSTGIIVFSSTIQGTVIPAGTVVYTDSGIRFLTDNQTTIFNNTASAAITAEEGGLNGNVPSNSIINTEIADVTCNNVNPTVGGKDEQSDEDLQNEIFSKVKTPITSGNVNHYREWAKQISGIGDARVIPLWNGNGTVKVILVSSDKKSVLSGKVIEVLNYINKERPIGATVTVESAVEKNINVNASLTLSEGYSLPLIKVEIERELTEYFKEASFVDVDIKISKIGNIMLSIPGVIDYADLKINNLTSNILINTNETPVLGVVTLV